MLSGESIICFAHDWGGDPTSKTHIMRLLARNNRVLWVNSVAMRRPGASLRDVRRILTKVRRSAAGCVAVEPGLFVASPLVLPLPGIPWADRLNARILARRLRQLCRRHALRRPILWTFLPTVNRLLGRLGESLVVYHCVDKYAAFSDVPADAIRRMEADLAARADLVLASSEQLAGELRPLNPNTHFISHGVDVGHFSRAVDPTTRPAAELRWVPRPIVGFFGLIADWVDLPLIGELARRRPGWTFVLIGKVITDTRPLEGLPNVRLLGQKPYERLPSYCRSFDVGLIPFRSNALTARANPLKLREYLAAGLPVVSTPLPEVARYDGLVRLADGVEGFLQATEAALGERSVEAARRRIRAMADESWEARTAEISSLVEALGRPSRS